MLRGAQPGPQEVCPLQGHSGTLLQEVPWILRGLQGGAGPAALWAWRGPGESGWREPYLRAAGLALGDEAPSGHLATSVGIFGCHTWG